jgi:hypothetical protein
MFSQLDQEGTPRRANPVAAFAFVVVLMLYAIQLVSLRDLFEMTNVYFVSEYMLCAVAFLHLAEDTINRLIGVLVITLLVMVMLTFGMTLWFSTLLLLAGYGLVLLQARTAQSIQLETI